MNCKAIIAISTIVVLMGMSAIVFDPENDHVPGEMNILAENEMMIEETITEETLDGFFVENLGQISDGDVLFYGTSGDVSIGFGSRSVHFVIREEGKGWSYDLNFRGSGGSGPVGLDPSGSYSSYFIGDDEGKWIRRANHFSSLLYRDLYPGIDMEFKIDEGNLKYDIIVAPGGDPADIRFRYDGADARIVEDDLHITTPLSRSWDDIPLSYQGSHEDTVEVDWVCYGNGDIGFEPDGYDHDRELVIDPNMVFSTYIGGDLGDTAWGVEVDDSGYIFMSGSTSSTDFPTTPGAYDVDGSSTDIFVMKMDPDTRNIVYSTYIGGSGIDQCFDISVDSSGSAYITGLVGLGGSTGDDFPTTTGAFDTSFNGGEDVIVVKLNPTGDDLLYSTFVGGQYYDFAYGIAVDDVGCAYVTGGTQSNFFPITPGALKTNRDWEDAFLFKLSSEGDELIYSTFWGGWQNDRGEAVAVDSDGCAYLTGFTYAENMPTTPGAFDRDYNGDGANGDCYLTKFNETGTGLVYSTYIGGSGSDWGKGLYLHDDGRVTITGKTGSNNLPTTSDAHSRTISGYSDAFVVEFNHLGSRLNYCSYIGGSESESAEDVTVDSSGSIHITGTTNSANYPTSINAQDRTMDGGLDGFVTRIGTEGEIEYSSFIGGSESEHITAMDIDPDEHTIYLAGYTNSTDLPLLNPIDVTLSGGMDAFLIRYVPDITVNPPGNITARTGDGYVHLTWESPTTHPLFTISRYHLYKGDQIDNITFYMVIDKDATSYNDTGLQNGMNYYYYMAAVIEGGEGPRCETVTAMPKTVPEPPRDVRLMGGFTWVKISWDVPEFNGGSSILHYRVFRGYDPGNLTEVYKAGKYAFSYNDSNLEYGCKLYYAVKAENIRGNGSFSNISSIKIGYHSTAPTNMTATLVGPLKILVEWGHPGIDYNLTILNYRLMRAEGESDLTEIKLTNGDIHNYTDINVTAGLSYSYAVSAINCKGESGQSLTETVTAMEMPGVVTNLSSVDGDGVVDLNWEYEPDLSWEKVSYRFYWGNASDEMEPIRDLDETSYRVEGLVNGEDYFYTVSVVNQMGEGEAVSELATIPFTLPTEPLNINYTREPEKIILTWDPPVFDGGRQILKYIVELEIAVAGAPFAEVTCSNGTGVVIGNEHLEIGTEYNFRIKAVNERGTGPSSASIKTIFGTGPGVPVGLGQGEVEGMFVRISWNEPVNNGGVDITGYRIYRDGMEIATVDGMTQFYDDHDVTDGSTYRYRVRSFNPIGEGETTGEIVVIASLTDTAVSGSDDGLPWIVFVIVAVVIILLAGAAALIFIYVMKGKKREVEDKPIGGTHQEPTGDDEISQIYSELGLQNDYTGDQGSIAPVPSDQSAYDIQPDMGFPDSQEGSGMEEISFTPPDPNMMAEASEENFDPLSLLASPESIPQPEEMPDALPANVIVVPEGEVKSPEVINTPTDP